MDEVRLHVSPTQTLVTYSERFSPIARKVITNTVKTALRAHPEGYQHMPKYRRHMWDGYICLYSNNRFPTGLLSLVTKALHEYEQEYEYEVVIEDNTRTLLDPSQVAKPGFLNGVLLRDYQIAAIRELALAGRGVAHMATNSGKTYVIAGLCKLSKNSIVLTHKKELLYQTAEVLEQATGMRAGLIGDGSRVSAAPLTVAMVQTLHAMIGTEEFARFASETQTLIIDECHHTSSRTMYECVMAIQAIHRYGFSGTPLKHDKLADLQLVGATGDVLVRVGNGELIQAGYSAKPKILMYNVPDPTMDEGMLYAAIYEAAIVENTNRNNLIVSKSISALHKDMVVLVLVERLEHQEILEHLFRKEHVTPVSLNGSHSTEFRRESLDQMRTGDPGIYIATQILEEGVDVPAIDVMVMAGGGKSHIKVLQRVGRGMRRKGGNNRLWVVDFIDHAKYLSKHSKRRLKIYRAEGFEVIERNL